MKQVMDKQIAGDGSYGVRGVATGEFLDFVMMNSNSKTSPLSGYEV